MLDASGDQIALNALIIAAGLTDLDGSEGLTLKITGLDPQFDLSGATHLYGNRNRVWALTPAELASAKIDVPMNYSGTLNLTLIPVTTENDGHSLSGSPITLTAQVTPSPEATLNHSLTLNEDTLTRLDFTLQTQNGDSDEYLNAVWIKAADVDANPDFSLSARQQHRHATGRWPAWRNAGRWLVQAEERPHSRISSSRGRTTALAISVSASSMKLPILLPMPAWPPPTPRMPQPIA